MICHLVRLEDGTPEVFIQYEDEWTQENCSGQAARRQGAIPVACLANSRRVDTFEAEEVLGRRIEWLAAPPEPNARAIAREAAALLAALGLWAGLSLAIVVFVWRVSPSWTSFWLFILVPIYLPAPLAAFVYVLLVHPRTRKRRRKRAILLSALGWVLLFPIPVPFLPTTLWATFFFHPIPVGMEDAYGAGIALLISFLPIGIPYCYLTGRAAGLMADQVLEKRACEGAA